MATENMIKTADVAPAISVDFTSRLKENIDMLRKVLGIVDPDKMTAGNLIKIYKYEVTNNPAQVAEGETVPLTKVEKTLAKTVELKLNKFRKETTAEAIQASGRDVAINKTDNKLISKIRKGIKADFFGELMNGTGTATGADLQETLANAWAEVAVYYEDEDATPIYFVSAKDVAGYLGKAQVGLANAFGLSYIENFLGLGTAIVVPSLEKGKVIATATQNLRCAYAPTNGDAGGEFGLVSDETGLIGMKHSCNDKNVTIMTLIMTSVVFYPELLDGVILGTIGSGNDGGNGDQGNS